MRIGIALYARGGKKGQEGGQGKLTDRKGSIRYLFGADRRMFRRDLQSAHVEHLQGEKTNEKGNCLRCK